MLRYLCKVADSYSLWDVPRRDGIGSYGSSIFIFQRNPHVYFQSGLANGHAHQHV